MVAWVQRLVTGLPACCATQRIYLCARESGSASDWTTRRAADLLIHIHIEILTQMHLQHSCTDRCTDTLSQPCIKNERNEPQRAFHTVQQSSLPDPLVSGEGKPPQLPRDSSGRIKVMDGEDWARCTTHMSSSYHPLPPWL